ncbi:D-2-hydroxyacid dehydrogenase family protein [Faunimonas sp. B44]|uniref:D-2-hydroxyacid dehydrogenase family protein n=1 Tax=Faunimonas sp. B44 TaxID=3461493 RepID=UPI004044CFBF
MARIAILDDYQNVSLSLANWDLLAGCTVQAFADHLTDLADLEARLSDFDVVVAMRERTPFTAALIERLPKLRLLVTTGSRNSAIDLAAASLRGVLVCGTGGLGYPTAELTWALIMAHMRRIPAEDRAIRCGRWQTTLGLGLKGKTIGIIGLGRKGTEVAGYARAFGMERLAWSPNLTDERAAAAGAMRVPLHDLLRDSDIVTIHLVLGPTTIGLIGSEELATMKPGALIVNTSRGPIISEEALVRALEAGQIGGAALDVFDDEPLSPDHPLCHAPNTVLTPHLGYVTEEGYRLFYRDAVEDIAAFLRGTPVRVLNPPPCAQAS